MAGRVTPAERSAPGRVALPARVHDAVVMALTGVLAGCGLIYEYLLAHAAGRVLGAIEAVIFAMIGLMIVAMGIGSFAARWVRAPFTGFAWLEGALALVGGVSVLALGAVSAGAFVLPAVIAETYGLPPDLAPHGGLVNTLQRIAGLAPYLVGFAVGVLVGMEIPLIARVRQSLHEAHLVHNTGTIYGADYIGAGAGAAVWVGVMLAMEPARAAVWTATANLAIGVVFLLLYGARVRGLGRVIAFHAVVAVVLGVLALNAADWARGMERLLYEDEVVYSVSTAHQRLTVTRRPAGPGGAFVYTFLINGRVQFASDDERIYHALLTYPAMAAAARHERVLIVGGGDGLALRDVLRWNPQEVVLLDLDRELVSFFSKPQLRDGRVMNRPFLELNRFAFRDPRVEVRFGDAYLTVDRLLAEGRRFDVVIVDLPDPGHPDLGRVYSASFYAKLRHLLAGDGAMAVQSTSPYFARKAFLSIGKTVSAAGFGAVEQYQGYVPSFGQWGWTVAVPAGPPASRRIAALPALPVDDGWTTRDVLLAAFVFPKGYDRDRDGIEVNRVGNGALYRYYRQGWERMQGISGGTGEKASDVP